MKLKQTAAALNGVPSENLTPLRSANVQFRLFLLTFQPVARLGAANASVSLNQTVGADDEGELGDLFADREAADPFDEAEESLRRQGVRRALEALPERERRILELRFGFEGEPWTLEAIGNELDLTRERVRQLEGQALSRLAALRELAGLVA